MKFVIVTGMSGAGKSTVMKILEDEGFFCVDNLPPSLISKFAEICFRPGSDIDRVALGVDARGGRLFNDLIACLDALMNENYEYTILFMDASDEVLVKRYSETRRSHPLAKNDRLITGIEKERELLEEVRQKADYIIDTSQILTRQLKEMVTEICVLDREFSSLLINVLSFGFKYGVPDDADMVFDVRFTTNPFYVPELKELTGNDEAVADYVMSSEASRVFMDKMLDMLLFLIPNFISEGKNRLVIAIGCTGGKHRSVTFANLLYKKLLELGHTVSINHRDIR
ncbi:MAG: RNase adapter RapZ [Defluviitaleaceae bacterium]|nr:RNase adapter RapZ [Defluviitaleaceae bacterium]